MSRIVKYRKEAKGTKIYRIILVMMKFIYRLKLFLQRVSYLEVQKQRKFCSSIYFTLTSLGEIRLTHVSFRAVAHVPCAIACIHTIAV
jgi:hypothetical protein